MIRVALAMTFTQEPTRSQVLQGFFAAEQDRGSRTVALQPRTAQTAGRGFWVGMAPRPELMTAMARGPAIQAARSAPRSKVLPGMGRPRIGIMRGVIQRRSAADPRATTSLVTSLVPDGSLPLIGPGKPLNTAIRARMEQLFAADFSAVRVYEGPAPHAMGARALTLGETLYFAPGRYDPISRAGVELLGHELTHVVQQRSGRVTNPYGRGVALVQDAGLEAQADELGRKAAELWAGKADRHRRAAAIQPSKITFIRRGVSYSVEEELDRRDRITSLEEPPIVDVERYTGTWDADEPVVVDALKIKQAWELTAFVPRLVEAKSDPSAGQCSGDNWKDFDEGIDVAGQIANVDGNEGRDGDGISLWRAFKRQKKVDTVGILILDTNNIEVDNVSTDVLQIRWLVGYPKVQGVGRALLLQANTYNHDHHEDLPMYVISAKSAVGFYKHMGYTKQLTNKPCGDTVCGCLGLLKPKPA